MSQKPTLGSIVIYRTDGRNGLDYELPAIIACTRDSHPGDYPNGEHNPLPVPESDEHVHLTVFTPGGFGTKIDSSEPDSDAEFVGAPSITPGSGTYVEWNVPQGTGQRTWRWPTIVADEKAIRDDERVRVVTQADTASGAVGLPSVGP